MLAKNGMLAAILLEILGSVILIVYAMKYSNNEKPPILTKMITLQNVVIHWICNHSYVFVSSLSQTDHSFFK